MSDHGELDPPFEIDIQVDHGSDAHGDYRGAGSENYDGLERPELSERPLNTQPNKVFDDAADSRARNTKKEPANVRIDGSSERDIRFATVGIALGATAALAAFTNFALDSDLMRIIKDTNPLKAAANMMWTGAAASFLTYAFHTGRENTMFNTRKSESQWPRRALFAAGLALSAGAVAANYVAYSGESSGANTQPGVDSDEPTGAQTDRIDVNGLVYTISRPEQLPTFEVGEPEIVTPIEDGPNPAHSMGVLQWALNERGFPTEVVSGAQADGTTNQAVADWKSANGFDIDEQFDEEMFAVLDAQVNKVLTDGDANTPNIYIEEEEN